METFTKEITQMNRERLLQLADHLEHGTLGHARFDFGMWNDANFVCGTAGCALGECPILWPDDWRFDDQQIGVALKSYRGIFAAAFWFGINLDEAEILFTPCGGFTLGRSVIDAMRKAGVICPPKDATKEQVAANLRRFVAWKESA